MSPALETRSGDEPVVSAGGPDRVLISREEYEVLHEEVSRLPERYRVPVVLCELEGLTYQEAARRLRCPVGTVGVRLSRARQRLRVRLLRRGIVPAAALTSALFKAESTAAWVSPVLVSTTVKAATGFAAGDAAAAGLVSTTVVVLTEAVLKMMALSRPKAGGALALLGCLTVTVGLVGVSRDAWLPPILDRVNQPPTMQRPARLPAVAAVPVVFATRPGGGMPANPTTVSPSPERLEATAPVLAVERDKPEPATVAAMAVWPVRAEESRGQMLFAKEWVVNDPLTPQGDGLGPLYNETSCVACHGLGAPGGAGPESKNVVILTASTRIANTARALKSLHPGFAGSRSVVLHRFGTDPGYADWRRRLYETQQAPPLVKQEDEEEFDFQIRKALHRTAETRMRQRSTRLQPSPGLVLNVTERNSPALFGIGQIDAISSEVLIREAAEQPFNVRGRVNRNREGRVGRFGWKSQVATLHEFVRGACAGELGLEVSGHSQPVSPLAPETRAKGLDLAEADCDALVAYVRALPAPVVVDPSGPGGTPDMTEGRRLFAAIGCATCHAPSLGEVRGIYSDLLLHDMGRGLSDDGISYGVEGPDFPGGPTPVEWRTPPLWGFRDSSPYLHDGRAETLEEAVALHGGQGKESARQYFSLSSEDQARIESFLKSLVAPSAASMPGIILASQLESRIKPDEVLKAEALVRKQREEAALLEEQIQNESRRRKQAAEAANRARLQFPIATNLEKVGKVNGALEFYRMIAREAPETEEGRAAVARIARLRVLPTSP